MSRLFLLACLLALSLGASVPRKVGSRRLKPVFPSGKIVGGQAIDITKVPWTLALEWDGFQICGASIIGSKWALTAAHCTEGYVDDELSVRTNSSDLETGGTVVNVARILSHEKYDADLADYDVSLLELAEEIALGVGSDVIALADAEPAAGDAVLISGWGDLEEDGFCFAWLLNAVEVPVVDRETCKANYAQFNDISDRMICAGVEGKDSCQGDSGGPAVSGGKQVGIVSWGEGCARKDKPGVYTNIANTEIRDWIKTNSGI